CLSAVFLIAGISKLLAGLANSRKSLTDFGVPKLIVAPGSVALPVIELSIGLFLYPSFSARIAALSGFGLLVVFNVAIAANLVLGRTPKCNCFGQLHSKPIGWSTFSRNCSFAVVAALVAWEVPRQPAITVKQLIQQLSPRDAASVAVVL